MNITKGEDVVTYILPVLVNSTDVEKISSTSVTYIVVRKPIIIDKVYRVNPGWFDMRLPSVYKSTGSVTFEALVYALRWTTNFRWRVVLRCRCLMCLCSS